MRVWSAIIAGIFVVIIVTQAHVTEVDLRVLGTYDGPNAPSDICVAGHFGYVANGQFELQIIDISDLVHPRQAGRSSTCYGMDN